MTWNRRRRIAAAGGLLLAGCLALAAWAVVRVRPGQASHGVSAVLIRPRASTANAKPGPARTTGTRPAAMPLAACEARLEGQPRQHPAVAIVGASYTAGTGPGNPALSWAVLLARQLRWNAVVYGVPGAGYVRAGNGGRGPMARMLSAEGLRRLNPALVIVQAGFDDVGVPAALEEQRVGAAVDLIRAAAPRARIGLLTTFGFTPEGSPALARTDHAIIAGGTAADRRVIVMDPLAGRWAYPRAGGHGLHPTAAGDAWIARTVAASLGAHGVRPGPASSAAPVICDVSVGVSGHAGAAALRRRRPGPPHPVASPGRPAASWAASAALTNSRDAPR
jgi:acyl-CoA thioesterase-1